MEYVKFNVINITDIHWGSIDPDEQWKQLEFIFDALRELHLNKINIDLLVIDGDYFDCKLPLNSREALLAVKWLDRLVKECESFGVYKIRMVQGTYSHDNDQLDVFAPLEDQRLGYTNDFNYFKIIRKTTVEEIEGVKILYCPDELLQTDEYEIEYANEIVQVKDIGFFHGSFDVVYGELLAAKPELMEKKNVVFHYDLFNKGIKGPMLSGHWHDGKRYGDLYYTGSPTRYKFNEDEPKGISFVQYDTDDSSYFYKKILNPICPTYRTYEVYTHMYETKEDYTGILNGIEAIFEGFEKLPNPRKNQLRIVVFVTDDKPENDVMISSLRQLLVRHNNIKVQIKNKMKEKQKKESVKRNKEREEKFGFIYDKSKKPEETIHDFIYENTSDHQDIPIEYIKKKMSLIKK